MLSSNIEKSLDEIISASKPAGRQNARRGGGRTGGPRQRNGQSAPRQQLAPFVDANVLSAGPFQRAKAPIQDPWAHSAASAGAAAGANLVTESKALFSNLDPSLTEAELRDMIVEQARVAPVAVTIHYSKQGLSLGTAEVTFRNKVDAEKAAKDLDHALVDDLEMRVQVVAQVMPAARVVVKRPPVEFQQPQLFIQPEFMQRSFPPARSASRGRTGRGASRGGANMRGGRGGGRGGGNRKPMPTEASLDAEMDAYHNRSTAAAAAPSLASAGQP